MIEMIKLAWRDLGRNRRRSFFSALALAMGLGLLLLVAGVVNGEMQGAMESTIRLQSGHLQIRAKTYDESKTSLKWEDLIADPQTLANRISTLDQVKAATPRLYASGIVAARNETVGVRVMGIDPSSPANDPYKQGLIKGNFLQADDREGLLIGQPLADKLGLNVGDQVDLSVNTSNGDIQSQLFTIRGIYTTHTNAFDEVTVFLPLAKAQAITQADNHASLIFILLKNTDQTNAVYNAIKTSQYEVLTWPQMNELITQFEGFANSYMFILYLIVLAITASVIVNTLIMAVFERTREIGILAAIGMKGRRILSMFLAESTLLAVGGVIMGVILGLIFVWLFNRNGFYIGNMGLSGFLIGDTIYADLAVNDAINLTVLSLVVTLLAGLYPAILASRMEPVDALRSEK
jgi:ABC-type lipoprotein release transport system permease subunit